MGWHFTHILFIFKYTLRQQKFLLETILFFKKINIVLLLIHSLILTFDISIYMHAMSDMVQPGTF